MEKKLIIKQVMFASSLFAIGVFGFQEWGIPADSSGIVVFIIVMFPITAVLRLFGVINAYGTLNCYLLAANAVLWAIPFAVVYWRILLAKSKGLK
jgi:hypothetical protein